MRIWTVHVRAGTEPVLVREAFSWGALIFTWVWLLFQRAWIAAVIVLAAQIVICALAPPGWNLVLVLALAAAIGLFGHDLVRWTLARRGFLLTRVVAARDVDSAYGRLIATFPEIGASVAGPYA